MHIGLNDEDVCQRLDFFLLAFLLLMLLLQILLCLLGNDVRREVALLVGIEFFSDVDGKEGLTGEHLTACTLEVMVEHLHTVDFAFHVLRSQFVGYIDALGNVGLVGEFTEVAGRSVAKFGYLLCHLAPDGIDDDFLLTQMLILVEGMLHHLDDVGIETSTE